MRSTSTFRSDDRAGIPCAYFDGQSSRAHDVKVSFEGGLCIIRGNEIAREIPVEEMTASEPFGGTARTLRFSDGSFCEVTDVEPLARALSGIGYSEPVAFRIQNKWRWVIASFLLLLVILAAGYNWGLPIIAEKISDRIPVSALETISMNALKAVDGEWLFPSELSGKRKNRLLKKFKKIKLPEENNTHLNVVFRQSPFIGPNAFALPDGTIVFLDGLVDLAENDRELMAVFAHEAGHVAYRHGMRQIIQNSVVALFVAVYIGDVSSLAGALTGWVLESKYSRDFEREADRYAVSVLTRNKIPPATLITFLSRIEATYKSQPDVPGKKSLADYISTHPPTGERMKEIEAMKE